MGLAGESLVEARRLRPFVDSMLALKRGQTALCENLQAIENRLSAEHGSAIDRNLAALSSARQEATRCRQMLNDKLEEFEDFARRIEDLSGRLHHEVIASRMRPFADGVRGFPRLVRDMARQLGKQVRFEVLGGKTGVDRDILEKLESPLTHLIRNALDHGIETPERRWRPASPRRGPSAWRRATAPGCSRSPSPTTAGASTRSGCGPGSSSGGWPARRWPSS